MTIVTPDTTKRCALYGHLRRWCAPLFARFRDNWPGVVLIAVAKAEMLDASPSYQPCCTASQSLLEAVRDHAVFTHPEDVARPRCSLQSRYQRLQDVSPPTPMQRLVTKRYAERIKQGLSIARQLAVELSMMCIEGVMYHSDSSTQPEARHVLLHNHFFETTQNASHKMCKRVS